MLLCPRCQQDELAVHEIESLELVVAMCPECDALWRMGVPIRREFREDYSQIIQGTDLTGEESVPYVTEIAKGEWLVDAYRASGLFVTRCPDCDQSGLQRKRIRTTGAFVRVCPHCTAVWLDEPAPPEGRLADFLEWNGLTEADLVDVSREPGDPGRS